jgi:hypothetical protein
MVCELEGPMPILNISKTLKLMHHDTPPHQAALKSDAKASGTHAVQMLNCAENKVFRRLTIQRSFL